MFGEPPRGEGSDVEDGRNQPLCDTLTRRNGSCTKGIVKKQPSGTPAASRKAEGAQPRTGFHNRMAEVAREMLGLLFSACGTRIEEKGCAPTGENEGGAAPQVAIVGARHE